MSSKISVGVVKKIGQPNYGSFAASCHVEAPTGSDSLEDVEAFQHRARRAFVACLQAVDEQLANRQMIEGGGRRPPPREREPARPTRSAQSNGAGEGPPRMATSRQVQAIRGLAARRKLDLTLLLRERHGVVRPEDLTVRGASAVIDLLRERVESVLNA